MKKILLSLIVIYSMVFLLACPSKKTAVREAVTASYSLSGLTVDGIAATAKAYNAGIIDTPTKDRIANALKTIATGGKRFNQILDKYAAEAADKNEMIPADKMEILNKIFSDEVVAPFLEVLQSMKILSADKAEYLRSAINALRAVILTIQNGFSSLKAENQFSEVKIYVA